MSVDKPLQNFSTTFFGDGSKFVKGAGRFGTLITATKIFDGEFTKRKLDGEGCERSLNRKTNLWLNDFIGSFRKGARHGEGQCFYENGIYEGEWKRGDRSGRGIMWYKDGGLYIGEWKNDAHDGAGVFVKANGNRFEGSFINGMKHGEGTFFHCETGQVQKGVWANDVCKCSMMQDDEVRFRAKRPTPFPIPKVTLKNPSSVVARAFEDVLSTANVKSN